MRAIVLAVAFFLAQPLGAQQPAECKGKQMFDLAGGATACLMSIGPVNVTKSIIRDDGLGSSRSQGAVLIKVAIFGRYTEKWSVSTPRMRQFCAMFSDAAAQEMGNRSYNKIVVEQNWVATPFPANAPWHKKLKSKNPRQAAQMNTRCRSIAYF